MKMRFGKSLAVSAIAVAALAAVPAQAELVYGITFDNNLFSFDSASPNAVLSGVYASGLQPNEFIQTIDFRPATGELFALGSTGRLYTLNTSTGAATQVGGTLPLSGTAYGMDFNPTVDRIRVHSTTDQNLRLFPTGGVAATDPNLFYAAGDPGAGANPNIVATAYTNNFAGTTTTTLYSIDSVRDTLNQHQVGPGFAQMITVGSLTNATGGGAINFGDYSGFDVSPSGTAYVSWVNQSSLFGTINLANGQITNNGTIGGGLFVRDIAVVIPEPATISLAALAGTALLSRRRR